MDVVQQVLNAVNTHVQYAPFIIFGALLLAGFNIPVSEDGMLFISAVLAAKHRDMLPQLFLGVFAGAYLSDLICYWLGRVLGNNLWKIKFFAKMITRQRVASIHKFYEKYGMVTLIVGRFIPFGVRNGLFLTAGLGKMNFLKFSLYDLLACTISSTVFFTLYYTYGEGVVEYVKKGNIILFAVAVLAVVAFLVIRQVRNKGQ